MEFIEAPVFTKYLPNYLDDDSFKEFQMALQLNPRRRKGKRGGLRIIYFHFPDDEQIWLLTIYGKNEVDDLTSEQKRALKAAIDEEKRARVLKKMRGR